MHNSKPDPAQPLSHGAMTPLIEVVA